MRHATFSLVLAACGAPGASFELPPEQLPPPPGLTLSSGPWVRGAVVTVVVGGVDTGATVRLAASAGGLGGGPCPAPLGGLCLDLAGTLHMLGAAVGDGAGEATFTVQVPGGLPPDVVFLQAGMIAAAPAISPPLTVSVADPAAGGTAAELLHHTLAFYGGQRCGDAGNPLYEGHPVGQTCHLEDGPAVGADLTGGWHDAGDHLKFGNTTATAAYLMLKGFEVFPSAYADDRGPAPGSGPNGLPDVLDEVRFATDWLAMLQLDANTFVRRVGGDQDHDLWLTGPTQSLQSVAEGGGVRPVYTDTNADLAAMTAAALALMSTSIAPYDAMAAATYLARAEDAIAYATAHPGPTDDNFYPGSSSVEEAMCGAVELYRATGDPAWLAAAESRNAAFGRHWWVADWENPSDACRHSLAVAGGADALLFWRPEVDDYLQMVSTAAPVAGLAWFDDWGSLHYAAQAAFSAALLHDVTGDVAYRDFALGQLDFIAGDNPYNRSFVVGFGVDPPFHPQHVNGFGYDAWDWDLSAEPLHVLTGAMVAGPTRYATGPSSVGYADDVWDYLGNEVSISYNAPLTGLAAFAVTEGHALP